MFINNLDPVAISLFTFEIKWYSLSYIFGIIFGWMYCKTKVIYNNKIVSKYFDDLLTYIILGIVIGGRLGYVFFYNPVYFNLQETSVLRVLNLTVNPQKIKPQITKNLN